MAKGPNPRSESMPFRRDIERGPVLGSGQDNSVYRLVHSAERPHLRPPTGWVVKLNHAEAGPDRRRAADPDEAVWLGVLYKKNKYELLKMFMGKFIPKSSFVLANVSEGSRNRRAEYTLQREVPRYRLADLTAEQRQDPRLVQNTVELMRRLQYMYRVLGEVNARTASDVNLDAKLDLGGVSDFVKAEEFGHDFSEEEAVQIINENKSPNLLVDPETMDLYCIDFDQGQWTMGMDEAKAAAEQLVRRDRRQQVAGALAAILPDEAIQV